MESKSKISNFELIELYSRLSIAKGLSKNPLKFSVVKNHKRIEPIFKKIMDSREKMFQDAVKIDGSGNPVIALPHKSVAEEMSLRGEVVPFEMFEYESEESRDEFNKKLNALMKKKTEVNLITTDSNRMVKVSMSDGSYQDVSVQDILEDPFNGIDGHILDCFITYLLV